MSDKQDDSIAVLKAENEQLKKQLEEAKNDLYVVADETKALAEHNEKLEKQLAEANERVGKLEHEYVSTRGLWCFDRDPSRVDMEWIQRNAFQLEDNLSPKPDAGGEILLCPNPHCWDTGGYPVGDGHGGYEQKQCEFCWTVENSKFNRTRKEPTQALAAPGAGQEPFAGQCRHGVPIGQVCLVCSEPVQRCSECNILLLDKGDGICGRCRDKAAPGAGQEGGEGTVCYNCEEDAEELATGGQGGE